jgi:hypothetical protein
MKNAKLFHDGCNVCLSISTSISSFVDLKTYDYESINLQDTRSRVHEAIELGVKRLPSLVIDGKVIKLDDHTPIGHFLD